MREFSLQGFYLFQLDSLMKASEWDRNQKEKNLNDNLKKLAIINHESHLNIVDSSKIEAL